MHNTFHSAFQVHVQNKLLYPICALNEKEYSHRLWLKWLSVLGGLHTAVTAVLMLQGGGHTLPSSEWLNLVQADSEVPGKQQSVGCIRKIVVNSGPYELQRENKFDTSVDWPKFPPTVFYNPHMISQIIQHSSEPHSTFMAEAVCSKKCQKKTCTTQFKNPSLYMVYGDLMSLLED